MHACAQVLRLEDGRRFAYSLTQTVTNGLYRSCTSFIEKWEHPGGGANACDELNYRITRECAAALPCGSGARPHAMIAALIVALTMGQPSQADRWRLAKRAQGLRSAAMADSTTVEGACLVCMPLGRMLGAPVSVSSRHWVLMLLGPHALHCSGIPH